MPRKKQEIEPVKIEIYALIDENTSTFFVWKCKYPNHYQAYIDHSRGKNSKTKDTFVRAHLTGIFPKMYSLDCLEMTGETAYCYTLAWTRYFIDKNYTSLSSPKFIEKAMDMSHTTQTIYDCIKNVPIEKVICGDHILVENHKIRKTKKKESNNTKIDFRLSKKEFETVSEKARKCNLSLSKYCKNLALEGKINLIEGVDITEFLIEVRRVRALLRQILYSIDRNGRAYPADLERVQKCIDSINEGYKGVVDTYIEYVEMLKKLSPK